MIAMLTVARRRVLSLFLVPAILGLVAASGGMAKAGCQGADPAIVSAAVKGITSDGRVNRYALRIRVVNVGNTRQPSNLLQSVEIYENDIKLDTKGLPPLKPRQAYSFTYVYQRSVDAGDGTSTLTLKLVIRQPSPPGNQDCNAANDKYTVTF